MRYRNGSRRVQEIGFQNAHAVVNLVGLHVAALHDGKETRRDVSAFEKFVDAAETRFTPVSEKINENFRRNISAPFFQRQFRLKKLRHFLRKQFVIRAVAQRLRSISVSEGVNRRKFRRNDVFLHGLLLHVQRGRTVEDERENTFLRSRLDILHDCRRFSGAGKSVDQQKIRIRLDNGFLFIGQFHHPPEIRQPGHPWRSCHEEQVRPF